MKTKTQTSLSALDKALTIVGACPQKRENEFSVAEFAAKSGYAKESARKVLLRRVQDGKLRLRTTSAGHFFSIAE